MAVVSTAASEAVVEPGSGPIRTCIGCRMKAPADELFRVVVAKTPSGTARGPNDKGPESVPVVPDPGKRAPGRGAWLHPTLVCVEQAYRRRAYTRALKVPGPVDPAAVAAYVAQHLG